MALRKEEGEGKTGAGKGFLFRYIHVTRLTIWDKTCYANTKTRFENYKTRVYFLKQYFKKS